jgi:hypothetical protein
VVPQGDCASAPGRVGRGRAVLAADFEFARCETLRVARREGRRLYRLFRSSDRHAVTAYYVIGKVKLTQFRRIVSVVLPTCYKILMDNEIRHFSGICRLSGRHAITSSQLMRYGVFPGYDGCPTDMRNTNSSIMLRPFYISGCRADMRNSNIHKDLWLKGISLRADRACARLRRGC